MSYDHLKLKAKKPMGGGGPGRRSAALDKGFFEASEIQSSDSTHNKTNFISCSLSKNSVDIIGLVYPGQLGLVAVIECNRL